MIICGGDRKTSYYRAAAHRTRSYNLLCMLEPLRDVPFNVRGAPDTARFSFHRGVSRTIQRSTCTMIQTACRPAIARTSQSTDYASKLTSSAPSMKPSYHWKSSIRKELREPGKLPSLTTKRRLSHSHPQFNGRVRKLCGRPIQRRPAQAKGVAMGMIAFRGVEASILTLSPLVRALDFPRREFSASERSIPLAKPMALKPKLIDMTVAEVEWPDWMEQEVFRRNKVAREEHYDPLWFFTL